MAKHKVSADLEITGKAIISDTPNLVGDIVTIGADQSINKRTRAQIITDIILTGFAVGTNAAIVATDTLLGAFNKIQAQINDLKTNSATKTGTNVSGNWPISITGNAASASTATTATSAGKLTNARTINGVSFDGSANITLPVDITGAIPKTDINNNVYTGGATKVPNADITKSLQEQIDTSKKSFTLGPKEISNTGTIPTGTNYFLTGITRAANLKSITLDSSGTGPQTMVVKRAKLEGTLYTILEEITLNVNPGMNTVNVAGNLTFQQGDIVAVYATTLRGNSGQEPWANYFLQANVNAAIGSTFDSLSLIPQDRNVGIQFTFDYLEEYKDLPGDYKVSIVKNIAKQTKLNTTTGATSSPSVPYHTTEYIPVTPGQTIYVTARLGDFNSGATIGIAGYAGTVGSSFLSTQVAGIPIGEILSTRVYNRDNGTSYANSERFNIKDYAVVIPPGVNYIKGCSVFGQGVAIEITVAAEYGGIRDSVFLLQEDSRRLKEALFGQTKNVAQKQYIVTGTEFSSQTGAIAPKEGSHTLQFQEAKANKQYTVKGSNGLVAIYDKFKAIIFFSNSTGIDRLSLELGIQRLVPDSFSGTDITFTMPPNGEYFTVTSQTGDDLATFTDKLIIETLVPGEVLTISSGVRPEDIDTTGAGGVGKIASADIVKELRDIVMATGNVDQSVVAPSNLNAIAGTTSLNVSWTNTTPANLKTQNRIVVLGSSTSAGGGASSNEFSYVSLLTSWLTGNYTGQVVTNLALGGYTSYQIMPNGFVPPANRPAPDTARNITKALTYNPTMLIINMPSNDKNAGYADSEFYSNMLNVYNIAKAAGIITLVTTTQPRNFSDLALRQSLSTIAVKMTELFKEDTLDFYTPLTNPSTYQIKSEYAVSGDSVHVNNAGHVALYNVVRSKIEPMYEQSQKLLSQKLEYMNLASGSWNKIENLNPNLREYIITGLTANTDYAVNVVSVTYKGLLGSLAMLAKTGSAPVVEKRILVDLGASDNTTPTGSHQVPGVDASGKWWNNASTVHASPPAWPWTFVSDPVTTDNTSIPGLTFEFNKRPGGTFFDSPGNAPTNRNGGATAAVGDYPLTAVNDSIYLHNTAGIVLITMVIPTGVTATSIKVWGSRNSSGTDKVLQMRKQGDTTWLEADGALNTNYDRAIVFTGRFTGTQVFEAQVKSGGTYGYIGVIDMTIEQ